MKYYKHFLTEAFMKKKLHVNISNCTSKVVKNADN